MAPSSTCIYLLILLLVGAMVPLSQSASLGSGETVIPSSVEEIEQSSTAAAGITASPSPSPVLIEKKTSLSGTLEIQRVRKKRARNEEKENRCIVLNRNPLQ